MDTRQLLIAKKLLEKKILADINMEIKSFYDETGIRVKDIYLDIMSVVRDNQNLTEINEVTCELEL